MDDLFGAIGDAISSVAAFLEQLVIYLFQVLLLVLQFIWSVLLAVGNFFFTVIQDIGNFFVHLWNDFFKGIFVSIFNAIGKFGQWLSNIFGPVVKFLKTVSQFIDKIYRTYIMPFLKILRIARIFLTLLRALGIKWAGTLDSILGTIQNDIQRAFLTIKGYLNVLTDLLNILADPSNLLRRPTTLLSLKRVFNASVRMFTGLPPGFMFPSNSSSAPYGLGFISAKFDPSDPIQNPPASYYLAFDGGTPDFSGLDPGTTIADDAADNLNPLNFFSDSISSQTDCVDPESCIDLATQLALAGS